MLGLSEKKTDLVLRLDELVSDRKMEDWIAQMELNRRRGSGDVWGTAGLSFKLEVDRLFVQSPLMLARVVLAGSGDAFLEPGKEILFSLGRLTLALGTYGILPLLMTLTTDTMEAFGNRLDKIDKEKHKNL